MQGPDWAVGFCACALVRVLPIYQTISDDPQLAFACSPALEYLFDRVGLEEVGIAACSAARRRQSREGGLCELLTGAHGA